MTSDSRNPVDDPDPDSLPGSAGDPSKRDEDLLGDGPLLPAESFTDAHPDDVLSEDELTSTESPRRHRAADPFAEVDPYPQLNLGSSSSRDAIPLAAERDARGRIHPAAAQPRDIDQPAAPPAVSPYGSPDASLDGYTLQNPPATWQHGDPARQPVQRVEVPQPKKPRKRSGSRWTLTGCNLLVFVSSVCVMVLELTAARLIAKHVGSSLYTWTSVIGVVLAGITVGNFIGGWLADRFDERRTVARLFLLASIACLSVLWLDALFIDRERPSSLDWPTWVFLCVAQMFFLPALALGTISPVVANMALRHSRSTGSTVGSVYAWGALGSICGTFLTGFWLIDLFGTRMIIGGTAGTLALLGVLTASGQTVFRALVVAGWMQFVVFATTTASATAEGCTELAGQMGSWMAPRDGDLIALADWLDEEWSQTLDADLRRRLLSRCDEKSVRGLSEEQRLKMSDWLMSGRRDGLTDELRTIVITASDASRVDNETIDEWRIYGRSLGFHLNELGVLLRLRNDGSSDYHDESNYSYVNVGLTEADGDVVRMLRLDKLVHSYFNPDEPTKLYYEYEQIYAEVTERAARDMAGELAVPLDDFPGRDEIVAKLPGDVRFDAASGQLIARGIVNDERRQSLLLLSPHGDYWQAIEDLAAKTRDPLWGGFSSVPLEALPDGATTETFPKDRLNFQAALQTLSAFRVLEDSDVEQLCGLGSAANFLPWRRAVTTLAERSRQVSTLFIGGGGFVFPRWIEQQYPADSVIDVAELDPAVLKAVRAEMGLLPSDQTRVNPIIGDARNVIDDLVRDNRQRVADGTPPRRYDFIYGDAFNDFSVPWHLTTAEFNQKVRELLSPSGVYLMNIIDVWPQTGFRQPLDTAGTVLPWSGNPDELPDTVTWTPRFDRFVPDGLTATTTMFEDWQYSPEPFGGIEYQPAAGNGFELVVRGAMSDRLYHRLLEASQGDDPDRRQFHAAVQDARRRSHETRGGRFLGSCVLTLSQTFPCVYVFSTEHGPPVTDRDTFVIIASLAPLDLLRLQTGSRHWDTPPFASLVRTGTPDAASNSPLPESDTTSAVSRSSNGTVYTGQMECILATARGLVLSDDYAPVDSLLRPVFEDQD